MKRIIAIACLLTCAWASASAQDFSADPADAIRSSVAVAQEIVDDPLRLAGLQAIVFRYNRNRIDVTPAGYESSGWLESQIDPIFNEVSAKSAEITEITALSEEIIDQMVEAYNENNEAFKKFYESRQANMGLSNISSNQMLIYLAAYAAIVNSVDSGLLERLLSFTGVWPLCFWNA